ncbi:MAG: GNAT family N-acetyltransferase, partial [Halobaculum sp.]
MASEHRTAADSGRESRQPVTDGGRGSTAGGSRRGCRVAADGGRDSSRSEGPVRVEPGDISVADEVADLWVRLASDQRRYGSHLLPESNRQLARDSVAQHAVTGGLFVARCGDELVGFVTFSKEQGDYDVDASRGLVHDLFVCRSHRDEGVGGRLLDAAEERLAADGVDRVSLEAMASNTDARRFYERRGYET